jgi:hypothetical protein
MPAFAGMTNEGALIPAEAGIQWADGPFGKAKATRNSEGLFQNLVHGFLAAVELIFHRFFK